MWCVAPLEMNEGELIEARVQSAYRLHCRKGPTRDLKRLTTLPPSCAVVMKSVDLNFLQPSGPLQACNGTALTFIAA